MLELALLVLRFSARFKSKIIKYSRPLHLAVNCQHTLFYGRIIFVEHKGCVMKDDKAIIKAALVSSLALTLSGCGKIEYVKCEGVAKPGAKKEYVVMDEGLCTKLAGGKVKAFKKGEKIHADKSSDYVKCYGVAAAGKNDCGTSNAACAGSVSIAKDPGAWIAALKGVCLEVGGKVGALKSKKT